MKPFVIWATGVLAAFAALAGVTTATRGTERVFVVVDDSFPMEEVASQVLPELDRIDDREYSEFALATVGRVGSIVHGYQAEIDANPLDPAGPCSFDDFIDYPEAASADERILITSSKSCFASELDGWTIIELDR